MKEDVFPLERDRFTFGLHVVPNSLKPRLAPGHPTSSGDSNRSDRLTSQIQLWVTECMHQLWLEICRDLRDQRLDFKTRLHDLYGDVAGQI
jgi:hypothetical protein